MATDFSLSQGVLTRDEVTRAADLASRAFFDDDYFRFLMPSDRVRRRASPLLFASQIIHAGDHALVECARDSTGVIVAVAIWIEPGHWPPPIGVQLAQMPSSFRALYRHPHALRLAGKYLRTILKVHPKELHWYLPLLAVEPSLHRRGVGTMLMQAGVARMESAGVGGYLETQKKENHAFYRRFGYEVRDTLHPVLEGPPYYTMWRPPR